MIYIIIISLNKEQKTQLDLQRTLNKCNIHYPFIIKLKDAQERLYHFEKVVQEVVDIRFVVFHNKHVEARSTFL